MIYKILLWISEHQKHGLVEYALMLIAVIIVAAVLLKIF